MRDPRQVTGADKIIVRLSTPIQYAAATLARQISGIWGDYVYLVDVKEDNARLASQNARLRERVRKLEELDEENRRLKRLLDLRTSVRTDVISAQVIGKDTNEFFRIARVTLDKDARNIALNLPVISPDGVVGTTLKVSGDTVDVRLVVDAGSGVDIVVQRTGARGFVRGTGDESKYLCSVEYVQRTDEIEVGDLLVTSGVGRRFPKGIPVGTVTQVVKRDFGIYQQVYATPAVDFSRLEEVLIVTAPPGEEPTQAQRDAPGASPPRK
jgi:rod shape-determining protein MreC